MKNCVQFFGLVATFVTSVWVVSCSKSTDSSGESAPTKTDAIENANQNADQVVQTLLTGLPSRVTTQSTLEAQIIGAVADLSLRYGLVSGEFDCNKEFKFGSSVAAATGISAPIPSEGYFTLCAELSFKDATKPPVYGRYVFQRVYPELKATSLIISVGEDGEIKGELSASDSAGRSVEYSMITKPRSGTVSNFGKVSGSFVYKPKADYHGSDTFTFLAKIVGSKDDDKGSKSEGRVNISVLSERDSPDAADIAIVVDEDDSFEDKINVKNIDRDVLVFEIGEDALNGSAVITSTAEGKFKYTPKRDFFGKDRFSISMGSLSIPEEARKKILVSVEVLPINDQVTASDALVSTDEDTALAVDLSKYVFDVESEALSYALISTTKNGRISGFDPKSGHLSYIPAKDYNGKDSFKFAVKEDGKSLPSAVATINIAVENDDNDAPVAEDVLVSVKEDSLDNSIRLVAKDSDSSIIYYQIVGFAGKRKIDLANGVLTATQDGTGSVWLYNPTKDKFGVDEIEFVATDGIASSDRKKLIITVENVADDPELKPASFSTKEDTKVALRFTTTNVDNPSDDLKFNVVSGSQPTKGKVEQIDGVWTYTPFENANGDDSWKMVAKNSDGRLSSQVTMSISIEPARDLPVARDVKVNGSEDEKISFRLDGTGIDVAAITYAQSSPISANVGNLSQESQGSPKFEFDPAEDFNGTVTFQYTVNDGISNSLPATVTINLKELNDGPVAKNIQMQGTEDQVLNGKFQGTDVDGDSLTYSITSIPSPEKGIIDLVNPSTGEFKFTPAKDFFGKVEVQYVVRDASLNSKPATVEINVAPVNDAPMSNDLSTGVGFSSRTTTVEIATLDVDNSSEDLKVVIVEQPKNGNALASGRSIAYTFSSDFYFGNDLVKFVVEDGFLRSEIYSLKVEIERTTMLSQTFGSSSQAYLASDFAFTFFDTNRRNDANEFVLAKGNHHLIRTFCPKGCSIGRPVVLEDNRVVAEVSNNVDSTRQFQVASYDLRASYDTNPFQIIDTLGFGDLNRGQQRVYEWTAIAGNHSQMIFRGYSPASGCSSASGCYQRSSAVLRAVKFDASGKFVRENGVVSGPILSTHVSELPELVVFGDRILFVTNQDSNLMHQISVYSIKENLFIPELSFEVRDRPISLAANKNTLVLTYSDRHEIWFYGKSWELLQTLTNDSKDFYIHGLPSIVSNRLLIGSSSGNIRIFDREDEKKMFVYKRDLEKRFNTDYFVRQSVSVTDRNIMIYNEDKKWQLFPWND